VCNVTEALVGTLVTLVAVTLVIRGVPVGDHRDLLLPPYHDVRLAPRHIVPDGTLAALRSLNLSYLLHLLPLLHLLHLLLHPSRCRCCGCLSLSVELLV
jgi:hypothetical protein